MTNIVPDSRHSAGRPLSAQHERLIKIFDDLEAKQLDFLDQAAKRVVELVSVLFGTLTAVFSLGGKFPPANLVDITNKTLGALALGVFVVAMLVSAFAMMPRTYKRYESNMTLLREELDKIISFKLWMVRLGGGLFITGTILLAGLLFSIIFAPSVTP